MSKGILVILAVVAFVLALGVSAEAQLQKQGSASWHFGWYWTGKVYELEKDHLLTVGEWSGTLFNDAGNGFGHLMSLVCPGVADIKRGTANNHGYCTQTDRDGDHIYTTWR